MGRKSQSVGGAPIRKATLLAAIILATFGSCTSRRESATADPELVTASLDADGTGSAGLGTGGATATPHQCPMDLPGPPMVEVPTPDGLSSYCVDSTEVTQGDYLNFVNAKGASPDGLVPGDISGQPPDCKGNQRYAEIILEPDQCYMMWASWDPNGGHAEYPVGCVDWCDAYMFCQWAGKRLCGRIGGGPLHMEAQADANQDQWFNACSQGGKTAFPYGDDPSSTACVTSGYVDAQAAATGTVSLPPR